jgi:hypothetical protein
VISSEDSEERWFQAGSGWIQTEEKNRMESPADHGNDISGKSNPTNIGGMVYPGKNAEIRDGKPGMIGIAQAKEERDYDKDAANEYFLKATGRMAESL